MITIIHKQKKVEHLVVTAGNLACGMEGGEDDSRWRDGGTGEDEVKDTESSRKCPFRTRTGCSWTLGPET